ncbi:phosphatase PAP2 family protein [Enterovirga rhinocerotis]|uniref:PAP2 superfamily protein n=1 Tax=Enterovirga rhinocerotis TaxID=1339210 RepID=A0A4R7C8R4_9HYPH|nr:phosphatase PAP2 family protein [Enterovirga rhinocerotis]TDR94828.1 PAP2 superfamily protein [Enterovirga rhinocerotis]
MGVSDIRDLDRDGARRLETVSWLLIAVTAAVTAAWFALTDMAFAVSSAVPPLAGAAVALACGIFYRTLRPDERLSSTTVGLAQLIAFPVFGLPLSYLVASLGRPTVDPMFHAWDLALGLDWRAYLGFVNERPLLGKVLKEAYDSLLVQMIVVMAALGLTGRAYQLQRFLVAYFLASLVTIAISGVLPAYAMFVHLGLTPADYANLRPSAAEVHVPDFNALRSGAMTVISLKHAEGIITFPSLHATLGLLFMVALWSVPWLRWPGVAVNLLLIAATPIDGGHYFVDVAAGLVIGVAALGAADALAALRRTPRAVAVAETS